MSMDGSTRDPQINPQPGDIVNSTIYKNSRGRHVTGWDGDYVYYDAVSPTRHDPLRCTLRAWQRWCAYNNVVITQRGSK